MNKLSWIVVLALVFLAGWFVGQVAPPQPAALAAQGGVADGPPDIKPGAQFSCRMGEITYRARAVRVVGNWVLADDGQWVNFGHCMWYSTR